jgi:hypothetical protein
MAGAEANVVVTQASIWSYSVAVTGTTSGVDRRTMTPFQFFSARPRRRRSRRRGSWNFGIKAGAPQIQASEEFNKALIAGAEAKKPK